MFHILMILGSDQQPLSSHYQTSNIIMRNLFPFFFPHIIYAVACVVLLLFFSLFTAKYGIFIWMMIMSVPIVDFMDIRTLKSVIDIVHTFTKTLDLKIPIDILICL